MTAKYGFLFMLIYYYAYSNCCCI